MTMYTQVEPIPRTELAATARRANKAHGACEVGAHLALSHAIEAGRLLRKAHAEMGEPHWQRWLREHCKIPFRAVQAYMGLHDDPGRLERAGCAACRRRPGDTVR